MVREVKVRMLHRYSSFVIHDDREWKVNQRMLKNNITLFVDSEYKLYMSAGGRV